MPSDKDLRDNTRALNNVVDAMVSLGKIAAELNRNLEALNPPQELHGVCGDEKCPNQQKHNHGLSCGITCSCESVRGRTSRQFQAYVSSYPVPVGTIETEEHSLTGAKVYADGHFVEFPVANQCRDSLCENEEMHNHGVGCGKSCSEPTCIRE